MIEVHAEFPQREVIQANSVVDNEEKTVSEVIISAKPEITGVTASVDNETGTPYVDVTETGTGTEYSFDLAFHNLKGDKGNTGETGATGNGIASIVKTSTSGLEDNYTITFTNGTSTVFTVTNGNGIADISKTSTSGLIDTYTITFDNGDTDTFTVTNGKDGIDGVDGQDGQAATITVGSTTTGQAGTSASVTNSGTSSAAILDFVIPKGDKGDTGNTGATGNGISSITKTSTSGLVDTYTIDYTNGNDTTFDVTNGKDGTNGTNGQDGFSPTATVTKSGTVATITITDKDGTTTANVYDGTGSITDVKVNNTSVVTSGVANIKMLDYYGTCDSNASAQEKVVVCSDFVLATGASIRVKFVNSQSYNGVPKLNVNGTGAIDVLTNDGTNAPRYIWRSGEIVSFTYDGTYWIIEDGGTASTTFYGYTVLATNATSTREGAALTPAALNNYSQNMVANYPVYSNTDTYAVGDRVRYSYNSWECNTAIPVPEAWDASHWTKLDDIQTQLDSKYPSSNPNGYTSNIGTVTSVNNTQPDANGNVSLTIPTQTDVQINGTSITSSGVANILTNSAYSSSNKIATMSDVPSTSGLANIDLSNLSNTGNAKFQAPLISGTNIKTINNTSILGSGDISVGSYSAGTGLSLSGTEFNHSNSVTAGTIGTSSATSGSTISVPYATYDAQGHITAKGTHTHTVTGFLTSSSTQVASSRFDGQWVKLSTPYEVSTNTSTGTRNFDISAHLPSTGTLYQVLLDCRGNSSGNSQMYISTSEISEFLVIWGSSNSRTNANLVTTIVGSNRIITQRIDGSNFSSSARIILLAYRRIGTNS